MALPLTQGGTQATSGLTLGGAADLLSIISGKDTTTTGTTTSSGGTAVTTTGGGTQSTGGWTSSGGTSGSTTDQYSTSGTKGTNTTDQTTVVDQIVSNSGSTNITGTTGFTGSVAKDSGYTTNTAGSTNTQSGSVNTNSGATTTGAASVNTGSQIGSTGGTTSSRTRVGGRTDVNTTKSVISKEAMDAMLTTALSGTTGLASVSQGVRSGGGYGGSTNTLLSNDLLVRTAAAVAEATRETVSTNVIGDSFNDTFGESSTNSMMNAVNNIGGTSSTVGPSTQTIGGSSTTIGPTSTVVGERTTGTATNSTQDTTANIGSSSSTTGGTNKTSGTTTTDQTTGTTGHTGTTGYSSSSGSTGGTSTTSPTTTTVNTTPTSSTNTSNTKVAGTGLEGLASIVGLTVGMPLAVDAATSILGSVTGALSGTKTTGTTGTDNTPAGSPTPDPVDHSNSDGIYGPQPDSIFPEPAPDFSEIPVDIPQIDLPEFEFADGGRVPGYADGGVVKYNGYGDDMEIDHTAEEAKRASDQAEYTAKHAMSREDFIKKYGETFVSNEEGGNAASEVHGQNVGEYYDKYLSKDAPKTKTQWNAGKGENEEVSAAWQSDGKYRYTHPNFDAYDHVNPHPKSNLGNGLQETMKQLKPVFMAASLASGASMLNGIVSGGFGSLTAGGGALSGEKLATTAADKLTGGAFSSISNLTKLLANPSTAKVVNFLTSAHPAGKLINAVTGLTGLPKVGDFMSSMMTPTQPTQPLQPMSTVAADKTANIVASAPVDELIETMTTPNQGQLAGYADGTLVGGAKTGGPAEDVADNKTVKVTPGEFIVPVDVVETPGVLEYLEKLVKKHHVPAAVQKANSTATVGVRG